MLAWIDDHTPLPPTARALPAESDAPGLLAAGGSLTAARLEEAYRAGVFPWYSAGQPVLWWSPDPRMVLQVSRFKVSRSLRKTLNRFIGTPGCEVRIDHDVDTVITACSQSPRPGQSGTWIVPDMVQAYRQWHRLGRVHSVETWIDGELAGGLYAVAIGRMVFGESMFTRRPDASKIALAALVCFCRAHDVAWIDCQQNTRHLASLGAAPMGRTEFEAHLGQATRQPDIKAWTYHAKWWTHLGAGALPEWPSPASLTDPAQPFRSPAA